MHVAQAFSLLILILYKSQLDACCAGFLTSHPDIASAAREQRPHKDHPEAGQDNRDGAPSHLADPLRRRVDQD